MIDAEEAYRIGLVNRIVPAEQLLDEARALLRTIGQQSPTAVRAVLDTVDTALNMEMVEALSYEARQFGWQCATADKAEGTAAFLAKRPPVFPGK
jgi:enoyl-CoA hydratase